MFQKLYPFFLLIVFSFCFTSCFQLLEEINLKSDGSGDAKITLNLSQSKSKVASLLLLDSVNGYKVPSEKEMQKYLNDAVTELKKNAGIYNVKQSLDMKTYIAAISFSFKNITAVNELINTLWAKQKAKPVVTNRYDFNKQLGIFKREYTCTPSMKKEFEQLKKADKDIFKTASYTGIFRFENPVVSSSNNLTKISPSGKAIMLTSGLLNLIYCSASISNTVQLSK